MIPVQFGTARITVNKDKLQTMSRNGFSPRLYVRMKTLFRKTDEFFATPKAASRVDRMSDGTQITIGGTSAYTYNNSVPFLNAKVSVRDQETGYSVSYKARQKLGEPVGVFLQRVLQKAGRWDRKFATHVLQPDPTAGSGHYTFNKR